MNSLQSIRDLQLSETALLAMALFRDRLAVLEVLAALVAIAVAAWWGMNVWKRRQGQLPHPHPQRLFAALCSAHRLDRNQRRLIAELAEFHRAAQPGVLFIQPERFDPANLVGFNGNLQEVKQLDEHLFGAS